MSGRKGSTIDNIGAQRTNARRRQPQTTNNNNNNNFRQLEAQARQDNRVLQQQESTILSAQQILDETNDLTSGIPASIALEQQQQGWWSKLTRRFGDNFHPKKWFSRRVKRTLGFAFLGALIITAFVIVVVAFARSKPLLPPGDGNASRPAGEDTANDDVPSDDGRHSPLPEDDRVLRSLREHTEVELHKLQQDLRTLTLEERALQRRIDDTREQLSPHDLNDSTTNVLPAADFAPFDAKLDQLIERENRLATGAADLKEAIDAKLRTAVDDYLARKDEKGGRAARIEEPVTTD